MLARLRSWWQKARKPLDAVIITLLVAIVALVVVVILGYLFNWDWAGLGSYNPPLKENNFQRGKTLWDWLQLLNRHHPECCVRPELSQAEGTW